MTLWLPPSSQFLQCLPSFISLKIPEPLGVWRIPLCQFLLDGPFVHGRSETQDVNSAFSTEFQSRLPPDNQSTRLKEKLSVVLTLPCVDISSMAWKHKDSTTFYLARAKIYDISHEGSDYYCIGRLTPPTHVRSLPDVQISEFSEQPFLCRAIGRYIYVFCNSLPQCKALISKYEWQSFIITIPNVVPFYATVTSPSCKHCDGMHEASECPFLAEADSWKHYLEPAAKLLKAKRQRTYIR